MTATMKVFAVKYKLTILRLKRRCVMEVKIRIVTIAHTHIVELLPETYLSMLGVVASKLACLVILCDHTLNPMIMGNA